MQYLFLILFTALTFSVKAEALDCNVSYDSWDPRAAQCRTQQSQPKRPATTNKNRNAQQQPAKNNSGTCVRTKPIDSCTYGWDNVRCDCKLHPDSPQGNNAGNNGNGQSATENSPVAAQMIQQCQGDVMQAQVDCDQDQDSGIQGAQSTLSNFAVQMGSQMGINGACSGLGKALIGANGAVTAFTYMCTNSRSKCMASCNQAYNNVDTLDPRFAQVDQNMRACRNLETKIAQASQAIGNIVNGVQGAQACAQQTGTDLFDFCKSNPTALGCSTAPQDCSNPTVAASNPICICKANPTASSCVALNLKAGDSGFQEGGGSAAGLGSNGVGGAGGDSIDGLINDVSWQGDPNLKPSSGSGEDVGGAKGGRPLMEGGGSAGGGGGGNGGGAGGAGNNVAVNSGFRGGGGGGGWFGGGSTGGAGGYAGAAPGQAPDGKGGPDLRQFLPGGKFDPKNRGLAGLSGPDGITGPHTDIWKKINNRYQIEKSKLMP
ncbi:hypothetical protein [Bdellovibrio sp. HCB337]|uniref:hypothetical protein n=1 Tax=Bdellovibrio sp. HCB337 TaxID=3394358 RepID=UPI0039A6338E